MLSIKKLNPIANGFFFVAENLSLGFIYGTRRN